MLHEFRIAETATFAGCIARPEFRRVYDKVRNVVYPQLKANPFFGPNIKRLKGELSDTYRYRIGNYRMLYAIREGRLMVLVLTIAYRQGSYK
ncbi:MAG: type II toxin-antitoxin system RelE/ParE family toxin [Planctomycetota bacterium]